MRKQSSLYTRTIYYSACLFSFINIIIVKEFSPINIYMKYVHVILHFYEKDPSRIKYFTY